MTIDYDAWVTGGNIFRCVRCGRRFEEHSYSADLCPMCQDELEETEGGDDADDDE